MKVYAYQAALICGDCGDEVCARLKKQGKAPEDPRNENTYDSDDYPKGPYANDSNDSDSIQHCDMCGVFLEVGLTKEGMERLYEIVVECLNDGVMSDSMRLWVDFYDVSLSDMIEHFCKEEKEKCRGSM